MVQMLMHAFSRGQDFLDEKVSISDAFEFLNAQSTDQEYDDSFIGFSPQNEENVTLQFIRHINDIWTLDIPTYIGDEFKGALNTKIHKDLVFSLVRDFFIETNQFYTSILNQKWDEVHEYCKVRYGIVFDFEIPNES